MDKFNYIKNKNSFSSRPPYRNENIRYRPRADICHKYNWQIITILTYEELQLERQMTQWGKTCKRLEQASHRKGDTQAQSCLTLFESRHCSRDRLLCPWDSPGKNTGVGRLSLLQGIFPTQRSNPGLPHCRQSLYQLNHQGSPKVRRETDFETLTWEHVLGATLIHCLLNGNVCTGDINKANWTRAAF